MTRDSSPDLAQARDILAKDGLCFVLVKQGEILGSGSRDGVGELLEKVEALQGGASDAALAGKIVGKAVVLIILYAGVGAVYTPLASEPAETLLAGTGVAFEYERLVPNILNRRGTDLCRGIRDGGLHSQWRPSQSPQCHPRSGHHRMARNRFAAHTLAISDYCSPQMVKPW